MKLKTPLKSAADLKRSFVPGSPFALTPAQRAEINRDPVRRDAWDHFERSYASDQEKKRLAATSPVEANRLGLAYTGPEMPDKGQKNGSCNRTACQMPLAGQPQFWMVNHMVHNGRYYYCGKCERAFSKWDHIDRPGEPLRCTPDEDNDKLPGRD